MLRKIKKIEKNPFFCKKSYFFWLNLFCIRSQLSFEVYNSSVAQNLKFWPFLAWKFSFFSFVVLRPVVQKVYHLEGCFWCLWTEKNQNIYLRPSFGLLVASKVRKLGGAIMAPPHVDTLFQIPCGIGLINLNLFDLDENSFFVRIPKIRNKLLFNCPLNKILSTFKFCSFVH